MFAVNPDLSSLCAGVYLSDGVWLLVHCGGCKLYLLLTLIGLEDNEDLVTHIVGVLDAALIFSLFVFACFCRSSLT